MLEKQNFIQAQYKREVLFETEAFEVVRCTWQKEALSKMHSHGTSQCSVLVENGVFENVTILGFNSEKTVHNAGQVFTTPLGAQHEIRCLSEIGTTLHVYSPKITKMDQALKFTTDKTALDNQLHIGQPIKWESVIQLLQQIENTSVSTHSPYFMNQLFSGVHAHTIAAESIVQRTRTTLATNEASPIFSKIEKILVSQLSEKLGWNPEVSDGICVAGGSAANMMALHCARFSKDPNTKKHGNQSRHYRIYVSDQAHYSFLKSANALGFGTDSIIEIQSDDEGRMCASELEKKISADLSSGFAPLFIAATAGTTVLGAFDPFESIGSLAKKYNLWFHIDAAWGAPAYFSKNVGLTLGSELADSLTFDAHKFFGSELTTTFFIVKNGSLLFQANDVKGGEYLFHESETLDRGRLSWQCGRGADFLSFWTLWKNLGDQGFQEAIDQKLELVKQTVELIKGNKRLKLMSQPSFLNVCVQVLPPEDIQADLKTWSLYVRKKMINDQFAMVNYSENQKDGYFLRLIIVHPQLKIQHVKDILDFAVHVR